MLTRWHGNSRQKGVVVSRPAQINDLLDYKQTVICEKHKSLLFSDVGPIAKKPRKTVKY